jgi:hypothetical protein
MSNFAYVRGESGGTSSAIVFEKAVYEKVEKFLARESFKIDSDPVRCVTPMYDLEQSEPIVRLSLIKGYRTAWGALFMLFSGLHFIFGYPRRTVYRANSEGLRLIAELGSPEKAYASL